MFTGVLCPTPHISEEEIPAEASVSMAVQMFRRRRKDQGYATIRI